MSVKVEYAMAADQNNLIWIDMEMTGLQPDSDRIIEIAMLVTDPQLVAVATGPVLVVHQPIRCSRRWTRGTRTPTRRAASSTACAPRPWTRPPPSARRSSSWGRTFRGRLADVRQFDLPGPALPRALDAEARGALPLPQPRRLDAEGAGAALEARGDEGLVKEASTRRWPTSSTRSRS